MPEWLDDVIRLFARLIALWLLAILMITDWAYYAFRVMRPRVYAGFAARMQARLRDIDGGHALLVRLMLAFLTFGGAGAQQLTLSAVPSTPAAIITLTVSVILCVCCCFCCCMGRDRHAAPIFQSFYGFWIGLGLRFAALFRVHFVAVRAPPA